MSWSIGMVRTITLASCRLATCMASSLRRGGGRDFSQTAVRSVKSNAVRSGWSVLGLVQKVHHEGLKTYINGTDCDGVYALHTSTPDTERSVRMYGGEGT